METFLPWTLVRRGLKKQVITPFDAPQEFLDEACRERQVGASGTWVTARVYVAVGISGAIQHLQGIAACDKVVAINLDPACDMVKRADLSVVGDSAAVLEALIAAVDKWRRGVKRDAA